MDTTAFENYESGVRSYCWSFPTVFVSASNARLTDEDGRSYIDFFAGAGVLNFGHNNPAMKRAMIEFLQADGIAHGLDMHTSTKRTFLTRFHDVILAPRGMAHRMQFTGPTGSNAVEAALKLARLVTGRREVVAFSGGFHGVTLGSLAATGNGALRRWAGVPLPDVVRLPYETAPGGKTALADYASALADTSSGLTPPAAFLVEVVQAEGGVNVASADWLHQLQDLAHATGALFIVDDIQAGVGRTGGYFSFDGMGLDPDVITLAKGLGGYGTPIAVCLNKPGCDAHWVPGAHSGTFRGQGLSMVAGTVALDYFTDDTLMTAVAAKGEAMHAALTAIAAGHPDRDWEVRGRGMLQGLDVGDGALTKRVRAICFRQGLLIERCGTDGRVLKATPPLTIGDDDLARGLTVLAEAVSEAAGIPA